MNSLVKKLKQVKDFRSNRGRRHPLWLVLLIIILATMQGYLGYRAIGDFAKTHQHLLVKKFNIASKKVPSYSTIRRVLMGVNWSNLQEIFNQWSSSLVETNELRDWICIDGKTLKSTVTNYNNSYQNFVSLVSLYSQNTGLVLGMNRFENKKSSEISQVNELVRDSSFTNKVFTLDALHCQKKTTQSIVESGNHYIVCVKKNQKKLYETLQFVANTHKPLSTSLQKERSHGRRVERQVSVFNTIDSLNTSWCGIKSLVRVERRGKRGNKEYHQVAYYISSLKEKAETFLQKIRGHWLIENQLHWIKDVILKEDDSPIDNFQARTNLSILQTIALNLFRFLGFLSITEGQRWLSGRWSRLLLLLE